LRLAAERLDTFVIVALPEAPCPETFVCYSLWLKGGRGLIRVAMESGCDNEKQH
jgi:hypothetical protein